MEDKEVVGPFCSKVNECLKGFSFRQMINSSDPN
jgi:hypothetical protein